MVNIKKNMEKKIKLLNIELLVLFFSCMLFYNMLECFWVFDSLILHKGYNNYHYRFLNMKLGVLAYPFVMFAIIKLRIIRNTLTRYISISLLSVLYSLLLYTENIPTFPVKVIGAIIIFIANVLLTLIYLYNYQREKTNQCKVKNNSVCVLLHLLPLFLIIFIIFLTYVHFIIF